MDTKTLYEEDLLAWSRQQSEALRSAARTGSNQGLDWENLAEEIEDLGKSQRRELSSEMRRIVLHLVKLQLSPSVDPRPKWRASIRDARAKIEYLLTESPSLRAALPDFMLTANKSGIRDALAELKDFGEIAPAKKSAGEEKASLRLSYSEEQVLGDWFPPDEPAGGE